MGQDNRHWMNESDIGSGERSAAQGDIERDEMALGAERAGVEGSADGGGGQVLRRGNHLARATCRRLDDGSYEAQVFVRLEREPDVAETYIPVGIFANAQQAQTAARERAERALREQEF